MCGIGGIIYGNGEEIPMARLEAMGQVMAHRGPDDHGIWMGPGIGLVHRRLSIIDLSSAGHQPMHSADRRLTVVFNGEIYNYLELAEELAGLGHRFRSNSDTEVLLAAYAAWGVNCLRRFQGMFAFALWDQAEEVLFCARDRVGIKPLYYATVPGGLVFGSEIKVLKEVVPHGFRPNTQAISDYLALGYNIGEETWFEGILKLEPGHCLTWRRGTIEIRPYWVLDFQPDMDLTPGQVCDALGQRLGEAMKLHLRSDVPVGAHLSGGIDSSSIVALMAREVGEGVPTFSGAFAEGGVYDERAYIRMVVDRYRTRHHEVVPRGQDLPGVLPRLLWHLDEPVVGPGVFPQFMVCQLVSQAGIKVVNGGQGGDEQFAGYLPYYPLALRSLVGSLSGAGRAAPLGAWAYAPQLLFKSHPFQRLAQRWNRRNVTGRPWHRLPLECSFERFKGLAPSGQRLGPFEQRAYMDLKYYLPGLLQVEDRTSMAWSIESRVPLLDHRLLELSMRIPSWIKVRRGVLKGIFREVMRGMVPDPILDRRDKRGFPTPIGPWFAGPLGPWLEDLLVARPLRAQEILDQEMLSRLIREHASGAVDHSQSLWSAMNIELWYRGNIDGWSSLVP